MDSETAIKVASHKFGNRKLKPVGVLARINKRLKEDTNAEVSGIRHVITTDTTIQSIIAEMNARLTDFFVATTGSAPPQGATLIKLDAANHFIPQNVWLGLIKLPNGPALEEETKVSIKNAREAFNDAAGLLRARVIKLDKQTAVLNDLGNVFARPNPGGVVVGVKHTDQNQP